MKHVVTGGAGFIGSHLVNRLVKDRQTVVVIDNLTGGRKEFLKASMAKIKFYELDILEHDITPCFNGADMVWHLAANPDVRIDDESIHRKQNFEATQKVLEAMAKNNVKNMAFTSSSTVYGEAMSPDGKHPTKESHAPKPVSPYGAAKLSSEELIISYKKHGINSRIFRLANVIGSRATHGVISDFIKKLRKNPNQLEILGDGKQTKSYIHIDDCIDAMMAANSALWDKSDIFNLGSEDWINVKAIADLICEAMEIKPKYFFTGGRGGWKGDVPLMLLDIQKIKQLGFSPKMNSSQAVEKTIKSLLSGI